MDRSNAGMSVMDRIAIAAVVTAVILILALVELTARSATRPVSATAEVAMATHLELRAVASNRCKSLSACVPGRK
jgi:hypothetical protein